MVNGILCTEKKNIHSCMIFEKKQKFEWKSIMILSANPKKNPLIMNCNYKNICNYGHFCYCFKKPYFTVGHGLLLSFVITYLL